MKKLSAEETEAISRISSLVLVNAMIFQEICLIIGSSA